jgi:hypothetical protein
MTSFALDTIPPLRRLSILPSIINKALPATATLSQLAYYANIAGLLSLVPASITGTHELYEIWKNNGTREEKDVSDGVVVQDRNKRSLKAGYYHAGMNMVIGGYTGEMVGSPMSLKPPLTEGISLYNWLSRRSRPGQIPTDGQSLISIAGIAILICSAYMGGELVYKWVDRMPALSHWLLTMISGQVRHRSTTTR